MKKVLFLISFFLLAITSPAQIIWQSVNSNQIDKISNDLRPIQPTKYDLVQVDAQALSDRLIGAVDRFEGGLPIAVDFPLGKDQYETFNVYNSGTVSKELQLQYPNIKSYVGQSQQNPLNKIYFTITPKGFHGLITGDKILYMDPYSKVTPGSIMIYNRKNLSRASDDNFECHTTDAVNENLMAEFESNFTTKAFGDRFFRTYRMAIAGTAEYTAYHDDGNASNGDSVADALAAMVVTLTRVNSVYEQEMSMRFALIGNNNNIIYTNSQTDPYSNYSGSDMLGENESNLNTTIGANNYDIGHVFSTGGGGIAGTSPCGSGKARGVTGIVTPEFDPFDIDYVCHEIGHQYGASHTFYNGCFGGSPSSQPFETGSASTIMGYAGICAPNVQDNSDAYFHLISLFEMQSSIDGDTCDTQVALSNLNPSAPIPVNPGNRTIPRSTPFKLTSSSSVPPDSGEVYTYNWEQLDTGTAAATGAPQPPVASNTSGPMFRSKFASTSPTRYFPNLEDLVQNVDPVWEELPSAQRQMRFFCTIRDNNPNGGQTDYAGTTLTVGTAGPFVLNSPNGGQVWHEGESELITWSVNGTNTTTYSTTVNILLSTDGGFTYPITLASNTNNDGSQVVTIPTGVKTSQARVMVEASNNYFFDITNNNFEIKEGTFELTAASNDFSSCSPNDGNFSFTYNAAPNFNEIINFAAVGLPAGLSASFSPSNTSVDTNVNVSITGTPNVDAGQYNFSVQAQSTSVTITEDFNFKVFENSVGDVVLTSPINGAGNQVANPLLEWIDLESASSYLVEISESSNFSSIVESNTVSFQNVYQPSSLVHSTIYYWKVTPSNDCSTGQNASISSFQTAQDVCRVYDNETYINTAQPSNRQNEWNTSVNAVSAIVNVPDDIEVTNLSFYMNATHGDTGDIKMQLSAPSGRFSEVYNRECAAGSNFNLIVSDQGTQNFGCNPGYTGALTGNQRPGQAFSRFNGLSAQGDWVLLATDRTPGTRGVGTFNQFSVTVCGRLQYVNDIDNNRNLGLTTSFNATSIINQTLLRSVQPGFTNANLTYVVTNNTDYGSIQLNGLNLNVGDTFTQGDLDSNLIQYVHDSTELSNSDSFGYTVLGASNTVLPGEVFNISIEDPVLIYQSGSWTPFAPNSETGSLDAQVNDGIAVMSTDASINNLAINGGVLSLQSDATLSVSGNLSVDGELNGSGGIVNLLGNAAQVINGSGILELDTLEVNNTAGVTFNTVTNIYNVLRPQSSIINANNNVVFKSNASTTGQLDNAQNATINGSVRVEQFIPAKRAFRFVSSSVNSTGSIRENWQENGAMAVGLGTHITGPTTVDGFDTTSTGAYSLFTFDNNDNTWDFLPNTNVANLEVGEPLRLFVRGDRNTDLTTNDAPPSITTLRSSGTIQKGDFTKSYTTANGDYAMIANPYQAAVDFKEVLSDATTTGFNGNYVYVWDPNINSRGSYVTVDMNLGNGTPVPMTSQANKYLQPGQSVFVATTGATSITFRESDKAVNEPITQIFSTHNHNNQMIISLKNDDATELLDQVILQYDAVFSNTVTQLDAVKFSNVDETLAVNTNGTLLSIEKREQPVAGEITPLHVANYRLPSYTLQIDVDLNAGIQATLVDQENGNRTLLQSGSNEILFQVGSSGSAVNRFFIEYETVTLGVEDMSLENTLVVYPNPVTSNSFQVQSNYLNGSEVKMTLFNALGQQVYNQTIDFEGVFTIKPQTNISSGMYLLKVETALESTTVQLIVK